ncbi:MAG: CHASE2 domain-containing protein, partial [Leptolyngbyaceae cyanobacterium]
MDYVVFIKLTGDLEQKGFQISLELAPEGRSSVLSNDGYLSANPDLAQYLEQWQQQYEEWLRPPKLGYRGLKPYKVQYDGPLHSLEQCRDAAEQLRQAFQQWLESKPFQSLEKQLCHVLDPSDGVRVLIRSTSPQIQALPWHLWSFIENHPNAEVAIGSPKFQPISDIPSLTSRTSQVSILAILGDSCNIDIDTDRQAIEHLPGAAVTFLIEPSLQTFHDQLYTRSWDILFFAGHSDTLAEGDGVLKLNPETTLTMEDVKYGVKRAIANGLQLAIFNSCKGVGLAHALAELQLPQMIVMRQVIPDQVAHAFLKYFLDGFAQGMSLYQAGRQARERLQPLEQESPCATWLPMIYQNPAKIPPTWQNLQYPTQRSNRPPPTRTRPVSAITKIAVIAIASMLVTSLVVGVRSLGLLQASELHAFDHFMQLRARPVPDERVVVITVDSEDINYQNDHNFDLPEGGFASLSDQALGQLLRWFASNPPRVIGLDIFHPYAFDASIIDDLNAANMVAVCEIGTEETPTYDRTPPPGFAGERLGFADLA